MCKHNSTRRIAIIGTNVDWIVCNACDCLIGVVNRGEDTKRFPYRSVVGDMEEMHRAKHERW